MAKVLDELVQLLALERIEEDLFRGQSQDLGWGTVFGGQVLGQALSAAAQTVPTDRFAHSLQAYFLRPGDVSRPVVYDVDRIRDGSSFTTRRVVAIQAGRAIFNLAASFQKLEPGFEHQTTMPDVPKPDAVLTEREHYEKFGERARRWQKRAEGRPFEIRPINPSDDPIHPSPQEPVRRMWMRAIGELPDNPSLHACLLAYASDFAFITTALLPHGVTGQTPGMQVASLDHVMWFHRPFRVDQWLLYDVDSPAASGARGLVRGGVYTESGQLVVTTAQEGLTRMRKPQDSPKG